MQYAQQELGFVHLDAEFQGIVVIGRRNDLDPAHRERYRELSLNRTTVMSYDRLLEWMRHETDSHGQTQNCAPD